MKIITCFLLPLVAAFGVGNDVFEVRPDWARKTRNRPDKQSERQQNAPKRRGSFYDVEARAW